MKFYKQLKFLTTGYIVKGALQGHIFYKKFSAGNTVTRRLSFRIVKTI